MTAVPRKEIVMAFDKNVYIAHAKATGGRDGIAWSDGGQHDVRLGLPKQMGGKDDGTNPEQLFAAGYAACFIGAMKFGAGTQTMQLPEKHLDQLECLVRSTNRRPEGLWRGCCPRGPRARHGPCHGGEAGTRGAGGVPVLNATRNNIDVTLTIA